MVTGLGQSNVRADRKYLRPVDVVRQTGLSKSMVMSALYTGKLEAYRVGKAWVIPVDALDRWVRGEDNAA